MLGERKRASLGLLYMKGLGVPTDKGRAVTLWDPERTWLSGRL